MTGGRKLARFAAVLAMACLTLAAAGCRSSMCGNRVVARLPSPDGTLEAVLFERSCGATTGFSSQVSVLATGRPLADAPGTAFVADCDHGAAPAAEWGGPPVAIEWRGDRRLLVRYHPKSRVFRSAPELHVSTGWFRRTRVTVEFEPADDPAAFPTAR